MRPLSKLTKLTALGLAVGLTALIGEGTNAFAKVITVTGKGTSNFLTSGFSYDGLAFATQFTGSGSDLVAGPFTYTSITELSTVSSGPCSAPDGSTGSTFAVVRSSRIVTYGSGQGQIFADTLNSATPGSVCMGVITGSQTSTINYTLTGGTGGLATATGTLTETATNQVVALGSATAIYGNATFTLSGTVTK